MRGPAASGRQARSGQSARLHAARRIRGSRRRRGVDGDGRFLSLELVHRTHTRARQPLRNRAHLQNVRSHDHDVLELERLRLALGVRPRQLRGQQLLNELPNRFGLFDSLLLPALVTATS